LRLKYNMVKFFLPFAFVFFQFYSFAQNHVSWSFEYDKKTKKVIVSGRIEPHWHVYSSLTKKNAGPIPVSFTFEKYMVCDDKMCLPPIDVPFSIQINP